jgi:hypothetical protein
MTATATGLTAATDTVVITAAPAGLAWTGYSANPCLFSGGGPSALVYSTCYLILSNSTFTSKVMLVDGSGNAFVNTGADLTITLGTSAGSTSPSTLTVPHGASTSSASMTYSVMLGLTGILYPTSGTVTASAGSIASATARLNA